MAEWSQKQGPDQDLPIFESIRSNAGEHDTVLALDLNDLDNHLFAYMSIVLLHLIDIDRGQFAFGRERFVMASEVRSYRRIAVDGVYELLLVRYVYDANIRHALCKRADLVVHTQVCRDDREVVALAS